MKNIFIYLGLFNFAAIPLVIYAQVKDPCYLLNSLVGEGADVVCPYITNPFLNLLYLNIIFIVIAILVYANSQVEPPAPKKHFPHH